MTKIKFCGITSYDDAKTALGLGVDALGFNFCQQSPRYISPSQAQAIVRRLPPVAWFVGVFVNEQKEVVEKIARMVPLDTLQFHGEESLEDCRAWKEWRVILAVRLPLPLSGAAQASSEVDHLLFDAFDSHAHGGTGKTVADEELQKLFVAGQLKNAFLAGGLTPENVKDKVSRFRPFGVDVATGIEASPGRKDPQKMKLFVEQVRASLPNA